MRQTTSAANWTQQEECFWSNLIHVNRSKVVTHVTAKPEKPSHSNTKKKWVFFPFPIPFI